MGGSQIPMARELPTLKTNEEQTFQMMCVVFLISRSQSLQDSHAPLAFVQLVKEFWTRNCEGQRQSSTSLDHSKLNLKEQQIILFQSPSVVFI